ncbi:MAG: SAM-dependent methyltransferase [bacterium]
MIILLVIGLAIVAFIASKFWTIVMGAGWSPTPLPTVRRMLSLAEVKPEDIVYDLGCGDGRIIIMASREYGARSIGIEADPFRYLYTWVRIIISGLSKKTGLIWGNFFRRDLSEASVVTLFLSQAANNNLKRKLSQELKPGTRIVSYYWTFDGWRPKKVDEKFGVYLYEIGSENSRSRD